MIEYSITIGNIIEIGAFVGGGIIIIIRQSITLGFMQRELRAMQKEIEKISVIVTDNAVRDQKILNLEEDIRDLKKGRGWISEDISGEYMRHGKITQK